MSYAKAPSNTHYINSFVNVMNKKHLTSLVLLPVVVLFISLACRLGAYQAEPPSVQFITPNEATHEYFVNEPVEISFYAQGENEVNYVQAALGTPQGQVIASYGSPEGPGKTQLRETMTWTPTVQGRYIIYLTAYDSVGRASDPAHIAIQVYPKPSVVTSGSRAFSHAQSFDFVSGAIGEFTGGDLFFSQESAGKFTMAAAYEGQIGGTPLTVSEGVELHNIEGVLFEKFVLAAVLDAVRNEKFVRDEFPVNENQLYLYKRHAPPGEYILFMVTDIGADDFSVDYVVFDLPE